MTKAFAFKEWKLICDLLERGEQALILRKGGIAEGKRGFQWLHPEFFLFPTYFHEQEDQLRLPPNREISEAPTKDRDHVEIRLWAEIVETAELEQLEDALRLAPLHAWNEEVVRERFGWGEREGLSVAVLRVWKLAEPWVLRNRAAFGGCRSWLGLPAEEGLDPHWKNRLRRAGTDALENEALRVLRRDSSAG